MHINVVYIYALFIGLTGIYLYIYLHRYLHIDIYTYMDIGELCVFMFIPFPFLRSSYPSFLPSHPLFLMCRALLPFWYPGYTPHKGNVREAKKKEGRDEGRKEGRNVFTLPLHSSTPLFLFVFRHISRGGPRGRLP